ncbi:MAG: hypothetical protein RRA94_07075 [Bacteroidota bacterium]|nr:hypothetical protein [Bacteroidota bacterium]
MRTAKDITAALRAPSANILEITDEEIDALSDHDIELLQAEFGATVLMKLPPREEKFMQWLREQDAGVYDDLWQDDSALLVSLSFLQDFRSGGPGFRICELEEHANYFFTPRHVKQEGTAALKEILTRAQQGRELAVEEALMFEIIRAPLDIWHFCHRFSLPVARGKAAVRALVDHDWLVHLPQREDLVQYIEE